MVNIERPVRLVCGLRKSFLSSHFLIRPGRHDIQHNAIQQKGLLSKIQHNDTQDNVVILNIVMVSVVMLNVVLLSVLAPFSYIILVSFLKSAQNVPTHIFFFFSFFLSFHKRNFYSWHVLYNHSSVIYLLLK